MSCSKDDDLWEDPYYGKTQWEDALIKHGVMKPGEATKTYDDVWTANLERMNEEKLQNPHKALLRASEEEFQASKDKLDESDFEALRKKRLAELKALAARNKFGSLYEISETEWIKEINEEDPEVHIIVHLMVRNKTECIHFNRTLTAFAKKFKYVKCICIEAFKAAKGFPDEMCPTVLIYKGGQVLKQIQGFVALGGPKNSLEKFEFITTILGIVRPDLQESPSDAASRKNEEEEEAAEKERLQKAFQAARSKLVVDDDDSWLNDD